MSLLRGTKRALLGGGSLRYQFDLARATFTASMAKRAALGPFAVAPIVQGLFDGTGVPDSVRFARGNLLGNPTEFWYDNLDPYQGSIVLWWAPEESRDAGRAEPDELLFYFRDTNLLRYEHDTGNLVFFAMDENMAVAVNPVAGTVYNLVLSWDTKNTIDGTNYLRVSLNDAHTYDVATAPTVASPFTSLYIGSLEGATEAAQAVIEGLHIYRRVLFDGTYGTNVGNGTDEINAIFAAGAGADPMLITGSWDTPLGAPTDSAVGALTTGEGEAWSHPHSSAVLNHSYLEDGYYGNPWGVAYDGATTEAVVPDGALIQDLMDAECTVELWFRADDWGEGDTTYLISKRGNGDGWTQGLLSSGGLYGYIFCAGTDAFSESGTDEFTPDGKWHHAVMYFNDAGDRKIYLAIDGKWVSSYQTQDAGVGAIVTDVGNDLYIGSRSTNSNTVEGVLGWSRISDNARYTVGTDFVPPVAPPASDGNTVVMYHVDEGTGASWDNEEGTAAQDAALANHVWEGQWEEEGSPVAPYSVEFDGADTLVTVADAASIQDLHDAAMTVEAWVRADSDGENNEGRIFDKSTGAAEGYVSAIDSLGRLQMVIYCATTAATAISTTTGLVDGKRHHVAIYWDDANAGAARVISLAIDGVWEASYALQTPGVGAIVTDVGNDLIIGNRSDSARTFDGGIGFVRLSDNDRYDGANEKAFAPPSRTNPPAVDGNTAAQWDFRDGAETTLLDETANNNDGTITFGAGYWVNVEGRDMETDAPGQRIFQKGYVYGSDGANDGISQTLSGLAAGANYVLRVPLQWERDRRARQLIRVWDETNGASISDFYAPRLYGQHSGGNDSATLIVATGWFTQSLVGAAVYNITDGSSTTITAVSGDKTTITGVLAGGTDDNWDTNDFYMIVPPNEDSWVFCEPITFELPTIARNGAGADCVSISVKAMETTGDGVAYISQIPQLASLLDNPSLETFSGADPDIPDGWASVDLDAGDSEAEAAILHSGVASLQFNVGASAEGISQAITAAAGSFVHVGLWSYGDGSAGFTIGGLDATQMLLQGSTTAFNVATPHTVFWSLTEAVFRCVAANPTIYILADAGAAGARYVDDVGVI